MKHRKGSTIATWDGYTIFPLLDWSNGQKSISLLPRFPLLPIFFSYDQFLALFDEPIRLFLRKICARTNSSDYFVASIVAALHYLTVNSTSHWYDRNYSSDVDFNCESDHFPMLLCTRAWKLVNDKISFDDWKHLIATLLRNIHIVTRDHPLLSYSRDHIPYLSVSELDDLITILKLETKSRSSLGLQNAVQQLCNTEALPTFVIVPSFACVTSSINDIKHSCLPSAQLELDDNSTISLTALFDIASDNDVSICYVTDDAVEQRDKMLQCRIGQSCLCIRCQYELATEHSHDTESKVCIQLTQNDLIRIGRYLMMKEEFNKAKSVYREALDKSLSVSGKDSVVSDICHALGAVELSMGNFLEAQQLWKDTNRDHPELCSGHDGIVLQLEKMRCYDYFDDESCRHGTVNALNWDSPIPNCYVASVIGSETCQKVIDWAETLGKWTTKRHYAVPTFDVPIHTVPPLLDWFQNKFMNPIIQPLLANQFNLRPEGRFYVHDAFCVRYESNAVANHLPIHVDESTHSLVVALNDDFEGGGTYFPDYDTVLCPSKGSVISFRGDTLPHGGQAVTKGVRYILAVFLYYDVHHKRSDKESISTTCKRDTPELNLRLRKTKQQKTDFSFNFEC